MTALRRPMAKHTLLLMVITVALCALATTPASADTNHTLEIEPTVDSGDRWASVRSQLFGDRTIVESDDIISLDAPGRAFDAARVPVTMRSLAAQSDDNYIKKLYLVVDKNPLPVAATFTFEPNDGWQTINTELRVNEYSGMRVIAELNNGELHMDSKFIKAVGGCSAPPSSYDRSDQSQFGSIQASIADLLNPKLPASANIRIVHPNASGMQFDQISRTYIPAHFIHTMVAEFNDQPLFRLDTNFSMSQDPQIGFNLGSTKEGILKLYALDSKDQRFSKAWTVSGGTYEITHASGEKL